MSDDPSRVDDLVRRATGGEEKALAELFAQHRSRLRQMVKVRLDRRLQGRVDPSDVLQDAFVDLAEKLPEYAERTAVVPFYLWLRLVVAERLIRVHRHHLGAAMRDAGREVSIHRNSYPDAGSASMAAQLIGHLTTVSRAAQRSETRLILQRALDGMDPIDREVIALRHFEELGNDEVASVLGITRAAASKRYVRAMLRLKRVLDPAPIADNSIM
jgi:RNA polymerase sigma-70 factor (ECF subfamily)